MTTFRISKSRNFTTVDNTHINDDRLSWKATSILTYLLSKPDNWVVHITQLAAAKKCGIKAVYTGVRELKALGYIEHEFIKGDDGKFIKGQYIVHEIPIEVKPKKSVPAGCKQHTQNRHAEKGNAENRPLSNTDRIPLVKTNLNKNGLRLTAGAVSSPPVEETKNKSVRPSVSNESNFKEQPPITAIQPQEEKPAIKAEINLKNNNSAHTQPLVDSNANIPAKGNTVSNEAVNELFSLVKETHQQPLVKFFIKNKLTQGVHAENIKASILYSNDKSKGNTKQYRSYLGKTLDNGWALEYLEELELERLEQERLRGLQELKAQQERQKQLEAQKKQLEEQQERQKRLEQDRIINETLEHIDINAYDSFIEKYLYPHWNEARQQFWDRNVGRGILRKMSSYLESFINFQAGWLSESDLAFS